MKHVARNFHTLRMSAQAIRATHLAAALALLLALPVPATAQSDALAAAQDDPSGSGTGFGACRRDLLREAWAEIAPLEAEAVEREVVALCTERAEAIAGFLDAQTRLDGALSLLRAPSPAAARPPSGVAGPDAEHVERLLGEAERLRGEIESLRARIARLEGQPEGPETEAALAELREDLAAAEADLAIVEVEAAMSGGVPGEAPVPSEAGSPAAETAPAMLAADPSNPFAVVGLAADPRNPFAVVGRAAEDAPEAEPAPKVLSDGAAGDAADAGVSNEGLDDSLPPPSMPVPDAIADAEDVGASLPPDRVTGWRLIHAVRRDGGPWRVRLQALRETAFPVPGPDPLDPDVPETAPGVRWVPVADPPVTLAVGDELPDGAVVLAVTAEGVELSDPSLPDGEPVLLPFAAGDDGVPGTLGWEFETLTEESG